MNESMNCAEFQSRLAAWLAGETDDVVTAGLEAHLTSCAHCQATLESANEEEQALRSALAEPQVAERVAGRAKEQIQSVQVPTKPLPTHSNPWRLWFIPLLTAAAGFLLAMVILPRTSPNVPGPQANPPSVPVPPPPPVVAHLVAATGTVERFDDQKQDWVPIDHTKAFACPSDSRIRTMPDVRCEFKTGDGCVIRLNDKTEVTLLGSSSIELRQGQVWCRSPQEASLEVRVATTPATGSPPQSKTAQPTMWSLGPSSVATCTEKAGQVQVVSAEGEVNLRTAAGEQRLGPGQVAEISGGQVITPGIRVDPLLATSWMQPLLVSRGADNPELQQRVDTLLAEIGRAKIATLYEQEIRSLGEHAVLPLVRFIQSPLAAEDPRRRLDAMRLTADLAPVWMIPDLIDLLEDREPYVRSMSAATLYRLTALDMELSPQQWREPGNDAQKTAVQDWRNWWAAHRDQYPQPQVRITKKSAG
jgi:hypothetical protein